MKSILIILCSLLWIESSGQGISQVFDVEEAIEVQGFVSVTQYDVTTGNLTANKKILPLSLLIQNQGEITISGKDYIILRILEINNIAAAFAPGIYIASGDDSFVWAIEKDEFLDLFEQKSLVKKYSYDTDWDLGTNVSLPFKFRPSISDRNLLLSPEIMLNGYISLKHRIGRYQPYFLHTPLTFGLTTLGVSELNLNDNATDEEIGETTVMGVSLATGFIFELNEFQVGVLGGWDWGSGELTKDWIYKGKLWLSFNVGYTFLHKN